MDETATYPPTVSELIDTWAVLEALYTECIEGRLVDRRFDTPTAVTQAQRTIEARLLETYGHRELDAILELAQTKRSASRQ